MNWSKRVLLTGILSGSLILPGINTAADARDGRGSHQRVAHGKHKVEVKHHGNRFDRSTHDRREFGRSQRGLHRSARWDDRRGHRVNYSRRSDRWDNRRGYRVNYSRRHDGRIANRGHHNKAEIRQDFKDIRAARKDVREERTDLRNAYAELRKDRAELRRDIRNGASREEIRNDRREIREDLANIRTNRQELAADRAKLDAARQELKNDLRRR